MQPSNQRRRRVIVVALLLLSLVLSGLGLAGAQPQQTLFGYSRVLLPLVVNGGTAATPPPVNQPRIVAWLDIPSQVRINDRMQIIVNIQNQGSTSFGGRTDVTIPYDGRKFYAANSSFDAAKGDWVRANNFPTDLIAQFGPLGPGEFRRGVIYYDFKQNGADAKVGDKLRLRARFSNGTPACGQAECPTNERFVEVTDQFTSGGIGTLPPGSRQVEKLGTFIYGNQYRWTPQGFRPAERVSTWLNTPDGGQRPLTLSQTADSQGKVYFSIDLTGLKNGFYSIVAHGNDTRTEVVGEFQITGSSIVNSLAAANPALIALPAPGAPPADKPDAGRPAASLEQSAGVTTLSGVVAAAGTSGATRLSGVAVSVLAGDGSVIGTATSDSFGGYVIGGLPGGPASVVFDAPNALDLSSRRYQALTKAVTIPASGDAQLDAELVPGSTVSGVVTGSGTAGLPGVSVLLLDGGTVVGATTTAEDGSYAITGAPSGSFSLSFDPATADEAVRAFAATTVTGVVVSAPAPRSGQSVVLSRNTSAGEIAGQVVAEDTGLGLSGVFVIFERLNSTTSAYEYAGLAISEADGAYSAVLPPGTYRVSFEPAFSTNADSARYEGEYFDNMAGPSGATTIPLTGGAVARADAALAVGGTIGGTVTGDGKPLAEVAVFFRDASSGALASIAFSDADGHYRSAGLPAGSYNLEFATYLTDNAATRTYAGTTLSSPVTLGAKKKVGAVDVSLVGGGVIAGTLTGTANAPLANVLVLAINTRGTADVADDALGGLALSKADGTYSLSGLPVGSYTLYFSTILTGDASVVAYFGEYYNDAKDIAAASQVAVTAGNTTANINASMAQGGQIRGKVTADSGGFGLAGVLVEVYASADPNTLVAFAITDEAGDYATSALPTGASYLVFFDPSFGGGQAVYAAEYYDNVATSGAAQAISVPDTTPITGINAGLAALP